MLRRSRWMLVISLVFGGSVRAGAQAIPPEAGLPVIDWKDAHQYLDQEVIVQGKIVLTRNIGTICFLNFDAARSFTAIVHENNYKNFKEPPERKYDNKFVRIRGVISQYRGKPQIEIIRPDQVEILETVAPIPEKRPTTRPAFTGTVTVATYNVLNFFDDYDDPYHTDEGTRAKPEEQLRALAESIRALDADVLALQEVENRGYLERFVAAYLDDLDYRHVVCFEGNDRRGIDCAVLSRFPVGPVTSYRHQRFPDGKGRETWFRRDLLRAQIEPPGCPAFDIFVVHFKSKRGGPQATERFRLGEARQARKILDGILKRDSAALFLICGDFNDTWDSAPLRALRGEGATALRDFLADLPRGSETFNRRPGGMIDFVLSSPMLARYYVAKSYRVVPGSVETSGSDHNPVLVQFNMKSID